MSPSSPIVIRTLRLRDREALEQFLRVDPITYIYPLGWLDREGIVPRAPDLNFEFSGAFRGGELVGALLRAGRVLCFVATQSEAVARVLATARWVEPQAFYVVVGPDRAVDAAWETMSSQGLQLRLSQPQVVMAGDSHQMHHLTEDWAGVRLANPGDLQELWQATLDMHELETGEVPTEVDKSVFRRSIDYQIRQRRVYVWTEGPTRELRFKAAISAQCDAGIQLEGIYVPSEYRRQGYARRGIRHLCRLLFREVNVISLYVNRSNAPAISLYQQSLNFTPRLAFKTLFLVRT